MRDTRLQFALEQVTGPQKDRLVGFKIKFSNPYFARCVRLLSLDDLPRAKLADYEYQTHPKYIQFTSISKTNTMSQIEEFMKQISQIMSQICIGKVHNANIIGDCNYNVMLKMLSFSCCVGYKLVMKQAEQYEIGDMVLFYMQHREQEANILMKSIQEYSSDTLYYPLGTKIEQYHIPDGMVRRVFNEMLGCYGEQIQSLAALKQIHISNMGIIRHALEEEDQEKEWMLCLMVEGVMLNLNQFYLALENQLKSIPLRIVDISFIRTMKINKINSAFPASNNNRTIDARTLLLMDRQISNQQIQQITIGQYVLNDANLNKDERQVIQMQRNKDRFNRYMQLKQLTIINLNILQDFAFLTCTHGQVNKIVNRLKRYASKFTKQKIQCLQSQTSIVKKVFYKNYRQQLQKQYTVKFSMEDGKIIRTNFTVDSTKINTQLNLLREQIISKFVVLPSLKPVSKYLAVSNQLEDIYKMQRNPEGCWYHSLNTVKYQLNGKTCLMLSQFNNLAQYQEQILFILHNDMPLHSKAFTIPKDNNINTQQFMEGTNGKKPCRIRRFNTPNSIQSKNIMLMYFDVKRLNIRHIQEDITNCFKVYEDEKRINLFIGLESKRLVEQKIFQKFLIKAQDMIGNSKIKIQEIYVYYEDRSILSHLQRTICNPKLKIQLSTNNLYDKWAILKMNNFKQFILYYYWKMETYQLPGLDSFIFQYPRRISSKRKSIITIPTPEFIQQNYRQFLLCFKEKKIYEVVSDFQIRQHDQKRVGKQLWHLCRLLRDQFTQLEYFVAYARNDAQQIAKKVCLNIYYTSQNKDLLPIEINLQRKSVNLKKTESITYSVLHKKYIDWFKIITHQSQISNLQKSLQK